MSRLALASFALVACTRGGTAPIDSGAAPESADTLLASCTREAHDGATVWSCGEAFLVMDAPLPGPITDAEVAANLNAFEAELVSEGTKKATVLDRTRASSSTRIRVELPENQGRFFAVMVIVRAPKPRAISCSGKEADAPRCERIVSALSR